MNPLSLSAQAASCRHLLSHAPSAEIRACVEQAIKTLEWIERREELIKMLEQLRKDNPELYNMFVYVTRAFPGASISDIRSTDRIAEEAGL